MHTRATMEIKITTTTKKQQQMNRLRFGSIMKTIQVDMII